jgi:hypothetical protein
MFSKSYSQITLSNVLVSCRPIKAQYFCTKNGVPNLKLNARVSRVNSTVRYSGHRPLAEVQGGGDLIKALREKHQVFEVFLRPRGDYGKKLTYQNWVNFRTKMAQLADSIMGLEPSVDACIPVAEYNRLDAVEKRAAFAFIKDQTREDTEELAEFIQGRVTALKGTGEPFGFQAETSRLGVNYSTAVYQDREIQRQYLNIAYIR